MVLAKLGNLWLSLRNLCNRNRQDRADVELPDMVYQAQLKKFLRLHDCNLDLGRLSFYRRRKRLLQRVGEVMYVETLFKKWGPLVILAALIAVCIRSL